MTIVQFWTESAVKRSNAMLTKTILFLVITACWAVPSSIIRPCATVACVASNLAAQSHCNPDVPGFVPGEYMIKSFRYDTPYFNSTNIDYDLVITNHDKCFISDFYYNVETYMIVLGLDCPELGFKSTRTVIEHYSLQEDVVYNYQYQGRYPLTRLKVKILLAEPLDLCHSFTFADVTALPQYRINPNDPKTAKYLSKEYDGDDFLNIYEREAFHCRANQLARYYINSVLCDFGCNF